ncbi:hypothetical protein ACO1K5_14235, partial [Staphylococcus aureus]
MGSEFTTGNDDFDAFTKYEPREIDRRKEFPRVDSLFTQITGMSLKTITPFKPFMASSILTLKSITCADQVQPETKLM